jgi:hypothetical protein
MIMKRLWVVVLVAGIANWVFATDAFRTDINPALLYYQGFSLRPELAAPEHGNLFTNDWRDRVLDDRFGKLMSGFDNSFKLFRRAAKAQVPCDWGVDLSDGPHALLPGLAKAKLAAQTARLRLMWHLQNGKPEEARDDLLAAFVLGRNLSTDKVLISTLVQFAVEGIVASVVAENFYQLPPEILRQLSDGFEAAPPQGLVADCISTENSSFCQYYVRQIEALRNEDESRSLERIREMLAQAFTGEGETNGAATAEKILRAGGNTSEGVLKLLREMPPLYEQVEGILRLPAGQYEKPMADFQRMINEHPNPLVREFFRVFDNCRKKEFADQIVMAQARAGIAYKLGGAEASRQVLDPCTGEPFEFERFIFEGVDRGFRLRSKYRGRDFDEVLIFVEKPGLLFRTMGKHAGEKIK